MKRTISFILAVIMVIALTVSVSAVGFSGDVSAESVLLIDASNSRKLFAKDANVTLEPAGTTKLMTAIVAYENIKDLSEKITITYEDLIGVEDGNDLTISPMLTPGEEMTMKDILCGLLIASGNDAAVCLAVRTAGSVESFVELMNKKAKELGMNSTHFANPHGKSDEDHYTTAEDMSKLALAIFNHSELMSIISRKNYTIPETDYYAERVLTNTNLLLTGDGTQTYAYATGMLGGVTYNAGGCLVSSAKKDGHDLICLVFGDRESGVDRWQLTKQLFDYGFGSYKTYTGEELFGGLVLTDDENTTITPDFSNISVTVPEVVDVSNPVPYFTLPEGEKSGEGIIEYYAEDGTFLASAPFTFSIKQPLFKFNKDLFSKIIKIIVIILIVAVVLVLLFFILRAVQRSKKQKAKRAAQTPSTKHIEMKKRRENESFRLLFRRYFPTVGIFLALAIIVLIIVFALKSCGAQ